MNVESKKEADVSSEAPTEIGAKEEEQRPVDPEVAVPPREEKPVENVLEEPKPEEKVDEEQKPVEPEIKEEKQGQGQGEVEAPPASEAKKDEETKEEEGVVEEATAEEKAGEKTEELEQTPEPAEEVADKPKVLGDRKWYVIQALTGQEDRVRKSIDLTIKINGLQDKVFQVLVPTEEIVEIKGGKRLEKVKKMFPGYVFLEMILDEESWYFIRETPGVARFIGTKVKPTPVSGKEMQRVLKQLGKEEKLLEITFEKGEGVRIISGPFRGYTGTVDEVNPEKGKLKILVNIFGRDTPVEVNFEYAQKII
ncbi:MAG: transcription termination/antitermination factor NusG [Candidatus Saganbacteria bacterium]|nr:transcription termination/antitermination factor NusG [Candidatus Saganbacteria bacterium]